MIETPYNTLRDLAGKPEGWRPAWAQRLEVHRAGSHTIYTAQSETLTETDLADLQQLTNEGWRVRIDGPRLSRIRIQLWKADTT